MSNIFTFPTSLPTLSENSSPNIMRSMFNALLPAIVMAIIFFGPNSLKIMLVAVISTLIFRYATRKYLLKVPAEFQDGSAIILGILLAFNLPAGLSVWIVMLGAALTIGFSTISFGKFGPNPFNAVLLTRVIIQMCSPAQMTTWPSIITSTDTFTGATPLGFIKDGLKSGKPLAQLVSDTQIPGYLDMFWGNMSGSLGEISAIAILIGGLYLIIRKIITWHIPVAILGSIFIFQTIFWIAAPDRFMDPVFHLITGGVMLGAFFMATDKKTAPATSKGKFIFGIGIGLITMLIRNFGASAEGIALAILVMNGYTLFFNIKTKPVLT